MSLIEWAERECDIITKHITDEGENDYMTECLNSAMKAYRSLLEDGHSGNSINITKSILNSLIDGRPLSPIFDTDDVWVEVMKTDEFTKYQCNRMSSLFKRVYNDGRIEFSDFDRVVAEDIGSDVQFTTKLVTDIINDVFPIEFPYYPRSRPYVAYVTDFLVDKNNGDFDTRGILYMVDPDGNRVDEIGSKYFKEENQEWVEIDHNEYSQRWEMRIKHQ